MHVKIPQPFRAILIAAIILLVATSAVCFVTQGERFGTETAVTGAFSVALLYVYVVWYSRVMMCADAQTKDADEGKIQEIAQQSAIRLQIGSLVRLFALSAFLIIAIVVFHFDVIAAIIGVTVMFLPLFIVPLFVKPSPSGPAQAGKPAENSSEVEKQC